MKELTFESDRTTNPSYSQADGYLDPLYVNDYLFCTHLYDGSGGIKDGTYLVPFERELYYTKRKSLASYRNFLKPIINALVEPVFSNPITRTTTNPLYLGFIDDCDNRETSLSNIMAKAATLMKLHGVTFVVMDNFNDPPGSQATVLADRKYPYIYIQPAYTVDSYEVDKFNKLISITFKGEDEVIDGKKYKILWRYDSVAITKQYHTGSGKDSKLIREEPVEHGLNVMPVIPVYDNGLTDQVLPPPTFYDIAKLNWSLFNKDSELRDLERAQSFSVFYAQLGGSNNNITIGPHAMMNLPADPSITIPPGYASPNPGISDQLVKSCNEFVESIYKAASQQGIVGIKQTSGIAEAYKFQSANTQLKQTANIMQNLETKLVAMFGRYTKQTIDCSISYTKQYDTYYSNINVDEIAKLLQLDISDEIKKEIKKTVITRFLNHLDDDTMRKLQDIV